MSSLDNPFDPAVKLTRRCSCGHHASQSDHDKENEALRASQEALVGRVVESAVVRALFPQDEMRRRFLTTVGAGAALTAISSFFPLDSLKAMAQEKRAPEKKDLKIGFIPITCASPILIGEPNGYYAKEGLKVQLNKTAGWALIRDKLLNAEHDASMVLAVMPLAFSLGAGSVAKTTKLMTVTNQNGEAITLANKHKNNRDPSKWKGQKMVLAVPFDFSPHNFVLRYWLAEHGLDPDVDVQIRAVPPPESVANLRAGNLDGYCMPDPFNQRAVYDEVGFIHALSLTIWDGHPCCSFGTTDEFIKQNPNTFAALFRAQLMGAAFCQEAKNRLDLAKLMAVPNYLNSPIPVLEQVYTGRYPDGLGKVQNDPRRIDFDPVPWTSIAVWFLTQMKRWGYIKGDVKYQDIADQIYLETDSLKYMKELGMKPFVTRHGAYKKFNVMGKEFDSSKPDAYLKSFKIKREV